jgi:hypothetical protein
VATLDATERNYQEKAGDSLSHLIGSKDETVRFLPDLSPQAIVKDARRNFSEREKYALIEEDGAATNAHKIDVKGTHYEDQSINDIYMMMPHGL